MNTNTHLHFLRQAIHKWACICLLAILMNENTSGVTVNDFIARVYTNAQNLKLPYRLFVPTNYTAEAKYPLVLYLHSALEFGSDNKSQITAEPGCLVFVAETNREACIMLAPQCPSGSGYWTDAPHPAQLLGLLDQTQKEFSIDPDRIYLAGMSMGGSMCWQFITQYPNKFAAGIPMSPGSVSVISQLTNAVNTAVWNFHAVDDGAVAVSNSRSMIDALRKYGGNPIYTEYASGGHSSSMWTPAFRTPGLVDWLMSQRRGQPSAVRPLVTITNPTTGPTIAWTPSKISLSGVVSDTNMLITQITWKNTRNNTTGNAMGTNEWSISDIGLLPGTNVIAVIAKGSSYSTSLRGNTFYSDTLSVLQSGIAMSLNRQDTGLFLSWSGGKGPFCVQACQDFASNNWIDVLTTDAASARLTVTNSTMFYRILGQ